MQLVAERQLGFVVLLAIAVLMAAVMLLPIDLAPFLLLAAASVAVFVLWAIIEAL